MTGSDNIVTFRPGGPLRGSLVVPGDKSITHRALMIGAVCDGAVLVEGPLWAGDTRATAEVLAALGVLIEPAAGSGEAVRIVGRGLQGLRPAAAPLNARNSGTTMRLMAGLVAGVVGEFTFDGDDSLRRRPMDRIAEPLALMGVRVTARDGRYPPITVHGGRVRPVRYRLPVASAQVKSCVLLAALHATGETRVTETLASRDHTERMLAAAGARVVREAGTVSLEGPARLALERVRVPGDPSAAAFLVAAACLVPGSSLEITGVGLNPMRLGFFRVLRRMGADLTWEEEGGALGGGPHDEPFGIVRVRHAALHGTTVGAEEVPSLIDEAPLLALVATAAEGETVVQGLGELRLKESDRLAAIGEAVTALGGSVEVGADAFTVRRSALHGGEVDSHGDHRLALLGAVAGLAAQGGVRVRGFSAAAVSYPGFARTIEGVLGR